MMYLLFFVALGLAQPTYHLTQLPNQQEGELAALIVTISGGGSYDPLFTSVPQKAPEGSRVDVYSISTDVLPFITDLLQRPDNAEEVFSKLPRDASGIIPIIRDKLVPSILSLEKESVVFNWECCSAFSTDSFGESRTITDIKILLDRGYMLMFSDFALKALIKEWREELGPNPLVHFSNFGGQFDLFFLPEQLKTCPSSQLEKLGELSPEGMTTVHAMSNTIAFTVDTSIAESAEAKSHYDLQVLTIVTEMSSGVLSSSPHLLTLGDRRGAAGHVLMNYKSGGKLLLSCGHWIEISHIKVTEDSLLASTRKYYGEEASAMLLVDLDNTDSAEERENLIQRFSAKYVQESIPGQYKSNSKEEEKAEL